MLTTLSFLQWNYKIVNTSVSYTHEVLFKVITCSLTRKMFFVCQFGMFFHLIFFGIYLIFRFRYRKKTKGSMEKEENPKVIVTSF